jgi:HSP20 family protein
MLTREFDIFNDVLGLKNIVDGYFETNRERVGYPPVNLFENGDTIKAEIIVPGADRSDIQLEIVENTLNISFTKKAETESTEFIRRERGSGKFSKSIRMPFSVNPDSINAELKNGILTVTLEKSDQAKPRKIEIK